MGLPEFVFAAIMRSDTASVSYSWAPAGGVPRPSLM
jgi:hypothetical protein